jgi:ParB family chromosome partitioning protein
MVARRRHWGGNGPVSLAEVVRERAVRDEPAIRVPVDLVDPDPRNPRQRLDVDELAASIAAYGLLQPVVVREVGARYQLVAGHRRLAAIKRLAEQQPEDERWREVDAVLRWVDEDQSYLLTLTENLQREDLSPREEAAGLEVLVRREGWSVRRIAEAIHRQPMYVSRRLRVFDDPVLAGPVLANDLPVSTAEELLTAPAEERAELVAEAVACRWGQADARRAVKARRIGTIQPGTELLRLLRAAADLIEAEDAGMIPDGVRTEARRLLRRLGSGLR